MASSSINNTGPTGSYQNDHRRSLQMIESGAGIVDVLIFLTTAAEKAAGPGSAASILRLDKNGLLRNAASPRLPADYLKAIDGLKPDVGVGTCAAAAASGVMVVTPDFRADDKWAELRHLPLALGYVGAWSMPIKTSEGRVLGTFGTYFREERPVTPEEIRGVRLLASAAAIVLDHPAHRP